MSIVRGGLNVAVFELLSDVPPDLSILQVGVQLDCLKVHLLGGSELVQVEASTEEYAEDHCSNIVLLDELIEDFVDMALVELMSGYFNSVLD